MFKYLKEGLKIVFAGLCAVIILNCFCLFYYNIPRHHHNDTGATDYVWEANFNHARGTEGYAYGKTNNEGLNNLFDYTGQKINALLLGSSQMEAFNVSPQKHTAALLNDYFSDKVTYNLGVSGHDVYTVFSNLESALIRYKPTDYVIIQFSDIKLDVDLLKKVNDGEYSEIPSYDSGIIYELQRVAFFRLMYSQFSSLNNHVQKDTNENEIIPLQTVTSTIDNEYTDQLREMLNTAKSLSDKFSCKLILLYTPGTSLNNDGAILPENFPEFLNEFGDICKEIDIKFVNMETVFTTNYYENHILPYGFSNSKIGTGHLNQQGHQMIAKELQKVMDYQ